MSGEDDWFEDFEDSMGGEASQGSPYPSDGSGEGDTPLPGERSPLACQKSRLYTVVDKARLEGIQQEALGQVQGILGCDTTTARALLIHFSWDVESVLCTIAERGQEEVYKRAGLLSCALSGAYATPARPRASSRQKITCGVCMSDVSATEVESMGCGHAFCRDCWRQHLRLGVEEGLSRRLRCMAPGCGVVCDEVKVKSLLRAFPALVQKYEQTLLESYVDDNKRVKWCPSVPHCGHAVRVNGEPHCEVECACGQRFCFACTEVPHSPATCHMLRNWVQRCKDGSETATWLNANTKPCPKCAKPVEKAGGCNLVLCSNLDRYMHYATRYEAHLASLRWEERARTDLEKKVDAMIEAEASLSNYAWLQAALEQLFLARRVLAYSYIFAYYMFGGQMFAGDLTPQRSAVNQALFEDKQGQLEVEVERLAKLVEATSAEDIPGLRLAIINLASTINTRIVKMYEVIESDIAAQLAASSLDIAPYRGQRTPGGGDGCGEVYSATAAAGGGEAGPSHFNQLGGGDEVDLTADVVDLTAEQSDGTPPDRKGKGRAGSKRLRKG